MTTISHTTKRPTTRRSAVGFRQAARMERIKLRTLRSPWVTLLITVAGVVGLATAVGLNSKDTHGDITSNVLAGVAPGLLAFGVLGVLVMTNEYSSGLIKATLAAVPHRGTLLAAKTAVFGAVALAVGEIASFAAFFAGTAALPARVPRAVAERPDGAAGGADGRRGLPAHRAAWPGHRRDRAARGRGHWGGHRRGVRRRAGARGADPLARRLRADHHRL